VDLVRALSCLVYSLHRERILEYRDESQRLDQCSRLYDSSISNEGFELDASHTVQVLIYLSCSLYDVFALSVVMGVKLSAAFSI